MAARSRPDGADGAVGAADTARADTVGPDTAPAPGASDANGEPTEAQEAQLDRLVVRRNDTRACHVCSSEMVVELVTPGVTYYRCGHSEVRRSSSPKEGPR